MKEIHLKVSNISQKQWANLLIELNLVKDAWQRFGPDINIKAKNFDKIVKWGQHTPGENTDNINSAFQRNVDTRKIRSR